jgi:hypothetical protein
VHYTQYIDSTGATELWTLNVATETRHRISANFVPTDSVEKMHPYGIPQVKSCSIGNLPPPV